MAPKPTATRSLSTAGIMVTTLIALTPAVALQLWFAGAAWALTLSMSCALALLLEAVALRLRGRPVGYHLQDGSVLVTAVLLSLLLPIWAPWWLTASGIALAVVVGKHIYGGLGQNLFNPVLLAYLGLSALFADHMGNDISSMSDSALFHLYALTFALLAGGVYLLLRGIISWHIPATMLLATGLLSYVFDLALSGSVAMLAAFYLATDPVTSPGTRTGKLVFGLMIATISVALGTWLAYPAAVAAAGLLMNAAVPALDHILRPARNPKQQQENAQ